jgi:hypothetical protein
MGSEMWKACWASIKIASLVLLLFGGQRKCQTEKIGLSLKKKSTTTENERVTGLRDYGVQSLIKAIIPPSNCLLLLLSSFFHLSSLDWQRERARQIRRQGFYFYSFFSFLTVIIIATKLLSYSYSFVSLFFFLFSFPLINGLV